MNCEFLGFAIYEALQRSVFYLQGLQVHPQRFLFSTLRGAVPGLQKMKVSFANVELKNEPTRLVGNPDSYRVSCAGLSAWPTDLGCV
jgi:hypothetical protein